MTHFTFNPFDPKKPNTGNSKLTLKVPSQADGPIIAKLLPDIRTGSAYVDVEYYKHIVAPGKEYLHPSRKSLGLGTDSENEAYWSSWKAMQELKKIKTLSPEQEKEMKILEKKMDIFKPSRKVYLFYVEPNSSEIKALKASIQVVQQLFGHEPYKKAPIPSLLKKMASKGVSPYDVVSDKRNEGWIKIYKTGEGRFGTQYHVEAVTEIKQFTDPEGNIIEGQQYSKFNVHDSIVEFYNSVLKGTADTSIFPDPLKYEEGYVFTEEESRVFTESMGCIIPDRFLKSQKTNAESPDQTELAQFTSSSSMGDLGDMPF